MSDSSFDESSAPDSGSPDSGLQDCAEQNTSQQDSSRRYAGLPSEAVERALRLFSDLVQSHPTANAEFARARLEFFGPEAGEGSRERAKVPDAERRLLEWFLFERTSEALSPTAGRALAESWIEQAAPDLRPLLDGLLDSQVGIFRVTSIEPGSGVWVRDLVGGGEFPLKEPEAASEFAAGDLVIGRLYPIGDGVFRASTAAACVRNPDLSKALLRDLNSARGSRRGVPRISQQTLESMFFQSSSISVDGSIPVQAANRYHVIADCRSWFLEQGVTEEDVDEILETLESEPFEAGHLAPGAGDILGGILSELAFHSDLDLGQARQRLLSVWTALWPHQLRPTRTPSSTADGEAESDDDETPATARRALEAFDLARAGGENIDSIFEQLERDLGLDPESGDDADSESQDFPGVVAAMVDEFLWERKAGDKPEECPEALHRFAAFGTHIGTFENITHHDLLLFTGCWLIERGKLRDSSDAEKSLQALERFCRWAESEHEVELWTKFGATLEELRTSLPRLVGANLQLTVEVTSHRVLVFEVDESGRAARPESSTGSFAISDQLRAHLRTGDLLRAAFVEGELIVLGCYPNQVRDLLEPAADPDPDPE